MYTIYYALTLAGPIYIKDNIFPLSKLDPNLWSLRDNRNTIRTIKGNNWARQEEIHKPTALSFRSAQAKQALVFSFPWP